MKILATALKLFNKQGISATSLRNIADETAISIGNLQYHFKKREDIVEALYFDLVNTMNLTIVPRPHELLRSIFEMTYKMIEVFYQYHFFFLDFVAITRKNHVIKTHYKSLSELREKQYAQIIELLIEQNIFRPEELDNEYQLAYRRIEVISNFWFSSILIKSNSLSKHDVGTFNTIINQSMYPYLTKKGKKQYSEIISK